jgi:hypothetical protein
MRQTNDAISRKQAHSTYSNTLAIYIASHLSYIVYRMNTIVNKEKLNQKINTELESEKNLLIQQTKKTLRELQSQIDRWEELENEKLKEIDQALIHFIAELKKYETQLQTTDKEFLAKLEGNSPDKQHLKEKIQRLDQFIQKHEA